jgi:hypothetical protein
MVTRRTLPSNENRILDLRRHEHVNDMLQCGTPQLCYDVVVVCLCVQAVLCVVANARRWLTHKLDVSASSPDEWDTRYIPAKSDTTLPSFETPKLVHHVRTVKLASQVFPLRSRYES